MNEADSRSNDEERRTTEHHEATDDSTEREDEAASDDANASNDAAASGQQSLGAGRNTSPPQKAQCVAPPSTTHWRNGTKLRRRDYLKAVGAAGGAASIGAIGTSTVGAQTGDWEAEADQRIQEHRTGDLEIGVVDQSGAPVENADVDVEMQAHDFTFGVAVSAPFLLGEDDDYTDADVEEYRSAITELFNTAVLGNNHKWRFFEDHQDRADAATAWLLDHGLDLRGHTCIWGSYNAWSVPGDVVDAMGVDHQSGATGPDLDPQHVRERSLEHVETIVEHYADFEYDGEHYGSAIDQWDVVNEVVHETEMIEAVDGENVDPVEAPILREWYERATEAAPDDVAIDVNDYNTIEGPYEYAREPYERQIEFLQAAEGVDLDGAGLQGHFSEGEALSPEETLTAIDRYAQHDVDVRITEFDTADEDWADDDQAAFLRTFLKTVFSHEAVEDFVVWGIWDPNHWRDDAPLFYDDWTPKPAHDEYVDLVFEEWWTDESGATDDSGTFATDAFLGEHEVTVTVDGDAVTETVSVTDADGTTELVVTVDGDGDGDDDGDDGDDTSGDCPVGDAATLENGDVVCDIDGDGKYRDLTASGDTTTQDLQHFFERQHREPWNSRTDLFDYTGNGDVGQPDVVDLFHAI